MLFVGSVDVVDDVKAFEPFVGRFLIVLEVWSPENSSEV